MSGIRKTVDIFISIVYTSVEVLMCILIGVVIFSPVIGTFFAYFNLYWGELAVALTILSGLAVGFFIYKKKLLRADCLWEKIVLLIILGFSIIIYKNYSPVLRLAQDPSIYMFKALNLVNYGHVYKPMLTYNYFVQNGILADAAGEYAALQSGTWLDGYVLYPDFFPGGTYFYAMLGFFAKNLIFYAQSVVIVLCSWLLFFTIKRITNKNDGMESVINGFYTLAFMAAPVIVWFGRGSFTEPVALLFLLLIINLLKQKMPIWILIICFLTSYSTRIDYIAIVVLGIFIITYIDKKAGILYSVLAAGQFYIYSRVYFIYYIRLVEEFPIIKYAGIMILVVLIISLLITKYAKEIITNIFYSKAVKGIVLFAGILCTLLMFYDNVTGIENYKMGLIHDQFLRTYQEEVLDLLFLAFPSIIIVGGLLGLYMFIDKEKLEFTTGVFLTGVSVLYLFLLFGGANSPMLYWFLRRYYNNVLPMALLAFCLLFGSLKGMQALALSVVCFMLSFNMFLNSGQTTDYEGLDKAVIAAENDLRDNGYKTIYYDAAINIEISPLFSYSAFDFVPLTFDELMTLRKRKDDFLIEDSVIFTRDFLDKKSDFSYELSFKKQGENYGELPKEVYDKHDILSGYDFQEFLDMSLSGEIYPYGYLNEINGINEKDGWMGAEAEILFGTVKADEWKEIVIEVYTDVANSFIDNGETQKMGMAVIVNEKDRIEMTGYKDGCFYFSLEDFSGEMNGMKIVSNTFKPVEENIGTDSRDLSIRVKRIYLQ